jgi:hypothetical protein
MSLKNLKDYLQLDPENITDPSQPAFIDHLFNKLNEHIAK